MKYKICSVLEYDQHITGIFLAKIQLEAPLRSTIFTICQKVRSIYGGGGGNIGGEKDFLEENNFSRPTVESPLGNKTFFHAQPQLFLMGKKDIWTVSLNLSLNWMEESFIHCR